MCNTAFRFSILTLAALAVLAASPAIGGQTHSEAKVRYILADITHGSPVSYYIRHENDANAVEAVRRWMSGVRVANPESFERKPRDGVWAVTYIGTERTINGMDVQLTPSPKPKEVAIKDATVGEIVGGLVLLGGIVAIEVEKDLVEAAVDGVWVAEKVESGNQSANIDTLLMKVDLKGKKIKIIATKSFDPKRPREIQIKRTIPLTIESYEHGAANLTMKVKWQDGTIDTWIFDLLKLRLIVLGGNHKWYVWHGRPISEEAFGDALR